MLRKRSVVRIPVLFLVGFVALIGLLALFQPVRTGAVRFLMSFRVNEDPVVNISAADVFGMGRTLSGLSHLPLSDASNVWTILRDDLSFPAELLRTSPEDFTSFKLRLPRKYAQIKPRFIAAESYSIPLTLNTDAYNTILTDLSAPALLSPALDNAPVTLNMPGVAAAYYREDSFVLIATQTPSLQADGAVKQELHDTWVHMPQFPPSIRSQLAAIDPHAGKVYLPVLADIARKVNIGGRIGYLYEVTDAFALLQMYGLSDTTQLIPGALITEPAADNPVSTAVSTLLNLALREISQSLEETRLLVWQRDNVIYILLADKPADDMIKIARNT